MIPPWMIEELERLRRERDDERRDRPQLWIELPVRREPERPRPAPPTVIVIELGAGDGGAPVASR
jgi:hypothetical protein